MYTSDVHNSARDLFAAPVESQQALAKLGRVNAEPALKLEGVVAYIGEVHCFKVDHQSGWSAPSSIARHQAGCALINCSTTHSLPWTGGSLQSFMRGVLMPLHMQHLPQICIDWSLLSHMQAMSCLLHACRRQGRARRREPDGRGRALLCRGHGGVSWPGHWPGGGHLPGPLLRLLLTFACWQVSSRVVQERHFGLAPFTPSGRGLAASWAKPGWI